jgi:hypothetical protein
VIISEEFSPPIISIVQDIFPLSCVYIFRKNNVPHEKWSKVAGAYTDIAPICEALKQATRDCDHNSISITFAKKMDKATNSNRDTLDCSFMYTQILKEILLTVDFDQGHIKEFLTYCREQFAGNDAELKHIDMIEKDYHHHQPIWWYTYPCFLYSVLNRALRMMEADLIVNGILIFSFIFTPIPR